MTITKKQILEALGIDYPVSKDELTTALLEVESIESESSDNSYRAFVRTMQVKDRW